MATVSIADTVLTDISKALQQSQRDLTNQDSFFFGSGDVTLTKMDNTTTKISSLSKILGQFTDYLSNNGSLGTSDLNSFDGLKEGKYHQPATANATTARHYPAANKAGILLVYQVGVVNTHSALQIYITAEGMPEIYFRFGNAASAAATAATWSGWNEFKTTGAGGKLSIKDGGTANDSSVTDADRQTVRNNIGLSKVLNARQLDQVILREDPGNGNRWFKVATITDPDQGTAQLDLMVTGGVNSGAHPHHVDFVFINGRGYTAAALADAATGATHKAFDASEFLSVRRIGDSTAAVTNFPKYLLHRNTNEKFEIYIQKTPYSSPIHVSRIHTHAIDESKATVDYLGDAYTTTATAPTNLINVAPYNIYDSKNFATGTTAGTICKGDDTRLNTLNGKTGGTVNGNTTFANDLTINGAVYSKHGINNTGNVAATGDFVAVKDTFTNQDHDHNYGQKFISLFKNRGAYSFPEGARFEFYLEEDTGHDHWGSVQLNGWQHSNVWLFRPSGQLQGNGDYVKNSDIRHKFNFEKIDEPLKAILSFRGVMYDKKDGPRDIGLIAQDVEKKCKIAVGSAPRTFEDGKHFTDLKYLNTTGVSAAYSVEAMKEMVRLMRLCLTDPAAALEKLDELCGSINDETPQDFGGEKWQL